MNMKQEDKEIITKLQKLIKKPAGINKLIVMNGKKVKEVNNRITRIETDSNNMMNIIN